MAFFIKQNDTSPAIRTTLYDGNNLPQDITGNNGVRFHMRAVGGAVVIDEAATVVDAGGGVVGYTFDASETATVGLYEAEFEVTYADNSVETFPNVGYIDITIVDDIA